MRPRSRVQSPPQPRRGARHVLVGRMNRARGEHQGGGWLQQAASPRGTCKEMPLTQQGNVLLPCPGRPIRQPHASSRIRAQLKFAPPSHLRSTRPGGRLSTPSLSRILTKLWPHRRETYLGGRRVPGPGWLKRKTINGGWKSKDLQRSLPDGCRQTERKELSSIAPGGRSSAEWGAAARIVPPPAPQDSSLSGQGARVGGEASSLRLRAALSLSGPRTTGSEIWAPALRCPSLAPAQRAQKSGPQRCAERPPDASPAPQGGLHGVGASRVGALAVSLQLQTA
ncbi:uncharacterized protein LOC112619411 [Theropithecus gelada]|uniref:uncharacterized protein LOC112619411 n=1 Tax=Theropithecus gelada TaxID=9565 RepID=UPI000DC19D42|nr:uncharacterized protein LOC112619411 [Theropithecus gelada]